MFNAQRRRTVAMIAFSMILFSLGCGGGSQTNSNQYIPTPTPSPTATPPPVPSACKELDPTDRATQVQNELSSKLGIGNAGNGMSIEVQVAPDSKDYLLLLLEGSSSGKLKFGDQMQLIEEYMHDKCIMKVFFVPKGTVAKPGLYLGDDFEWTSCDWPKQPCTDGTCACS